LVTRQLSRQPLGAAGEIMWKYIFTLLIMNLAFSFQDNGFDAIKVGMKDSQVEKLLGLPQEIFRGFTQVDNYEVTIAGQINYTCWRYKQSKKTLYEESDSDIPLPKKDTVFIYNNVENVERSLKESQKIGDTIYYLCKSSDYNEVITKEEYYKLLTSYKSSSVYCVPVESKRMKIVDRYDTDKTVTVHKKYFLISNMCVLFEPSSNRVVNVEYLPTRLELKISKANK
jgi:hypothetical protein